MNIDPTQKKRLFISIMIFLAILTIAGYFNLHHTARKPPAPAAVPSTISRPAITYIKAHEDAIGADQTSPSSWTDQVKSITTNVWYQSLQPPQENQTGSTSYPYQVAHDNGYRVSASVGDCQWVGTPPNLQTTTKVTIECAVYDSVVGADNSTVNPSSLPYGWANVGQQSPAVLTLVKQGSGWLISDQPVDQQTE